MKKIFGQRSLTGVLTRLNYRFDMMVPWDDYRIVSSHQILNLLRACALFA